MTCPDPDDLYALAFIALLLIAAAYCAGVIVGVVYYRPGCEGI